MQFSASYIVSLAAAALLAGPGMAEPVSCNIQDGAAPYFQEVTLTTSTTGDAPSPGGTAREKMRLTSSTLISKSTKSAHQMILERPGMQLLAGRTFAAILMEAVVKWGYRGSNRGLRRTTTEVGRGRRGFILCCSLGTICFEEATRMEGMKVVY